MLFGDAKRLLLRKQERVTPAEAVSMISFYICNFFPVWLTLSGIGPTPLSYRLNAACTTPVFGSSPYVERI